MIILAWNARGLGSTRAFQILLRLKQVYKPNLVFIMETKTDNVRLEGFRVKLGFCGKLVVNSVGSKGGLCLFWDDSVDISLLSYSCSHIDVESKITCADG